jgi:hypothetical protein
MRNLGTRLSRLEAVRPVSDGPIPSWALKLAEARHQELVTGKTGQALADIIGPRKYDPAEVERLARELAVTFRSREEAERGRPMSPAAKDVFDRIMGVSA